jgi:heme-degrading monooxygenase HmoA
MISKTPEPPYYAVIFTTIRTAVEHGYAETAKHMETLAKDQKGYLGIESTIEGNSGITVSYWRDLESIKNWKDHIEHTKAREKGRGLWYKEYKTRIAKVERDYGFELT